MQRLHDKEIKHTSYRPSVHEQTSRDFKSKSASASCKRRPIQRTRPAELSAFSRWPSGYDAKRVEGGVGAVVVALDVQHVECGVVHLLQRMGSASKAVSQQGGQPAR